MNSSENLVNPDGAKVLAVSELVRQARRTLEGACPLCWVSGELSGVTRAASGHVYFTLKDDTAQLRCTMWRTKAQLLPFQLSEGMRVEVRAQLTVYEARGDMQLAVEHVRRAGLGSQFEALMRLKARLEAEGLFDPARRRALPALPRRIGVVTSPAAAVLHDVLVTLKRRAPSLQIVIYPSVVQGDGAGARIAQAIHTASTRARQDHIQALIVCRGGGSVEDLWAFNDEAVARAVRACSVPVVSGVGHETDSTLCDFAADLRAPTPTAAAEALSHGHYALRDRMDRVAQQLRSHLRRGLDQAAQRLDLVERGLRHPRQGLTLARSQLAHAALRLAHGLHRLRQLSRHRLESARTALLRHRPEAELHRLRLSTGGERLAHGIRVDVARRQARMEALAARLAALNPGAVMQRGYAIVRDPRGGIVRDAVQLSIGDSVKLELGVGSAEASIASTNRDI